MSNHNVWCCTIVTDTGLTIRLQAIEKLEPDDLLDEVRDRRADAVMQLWNITNNFNTLNKPRWNETIQEVILDYQVRLF